MSSMRAACMLLVSSFAVSARCGRLPARLSSVKCQARWLHFKPNCLVGSSAFTAPFQSRAAMVAGRAPSRLYAASTAKGRPTLDDVERLSKGDAAKKRGTGSRQICHRLNEMERREFELAKKVGFVQLRGTGYRRERRGSPLANIHRQLCDALSRPCIEIHRGLGADAQDEVLIDISTLRPTAEGELVRALDICQKVRQDFEAASEQAASEEILRTWAATQKAFVEEEGWQLRPIWDLPVISYTFDCIKDRSEAKKVAAEVALRFDGRK